MIRFVIPAAGNATRFSGVWKELLPISETECGLTYAVRTAWQYGRCSPVIVTTAAKREVHASTIRTAGLSAEIIVKENPEDGDMWGSVLLGIDLTMSGGLILPDSVAVPQVVIANTAAISFGCFVSTEPWRFSCLDLTNSQRPAILTKPQIKTACLAWGIVTWDQAAAHQLSMARTHHDRAFEAVMQDRGYEVFSLNDYHDLGSFAHYWKYLNEHRPSYHIP